MTPEEIRSTLRQTAEDMGLSVFVLEKQSGVGKSTIDRYFYRGGGISIENLCALAQALGLEVSILGM